MGCGLNKQRYVNTEDALCAAATLLVKGVLMNDLRTYHCNSCACFHLMTARVQLHDWLMVPMWRRPKRVRLWFRQREGIC